MHLTFIWTKQPVSIAVQKKMQVTVSIVWYEILRNNLRRSQDGPVNLSQKKCNEVCLRNVLYEKCLYSEFFWSIFSYIRTK